MLLLVDYTRGWNSFPRTVYAQPPAFPLIFIFRTPKNGVLASGFIPRTDSIAFVPYTKNVHNPVGLTLNFSESTKSFNTRVPIRLKATINLVYMARDKIFSDTLQLALIKPLQPTSAKAPVLQVIDCACAPKTRFMRAKIAAVFRVATSNKNCK